MDNFTKDTNQILAKVGPLIIVIVVFITLLGGLLSLILADIYLGYIVADFYVGGSKAAAWFISFATTGVLAGITGLAIRYWQSENMDLKSQLKIFITSLVAIGIIVLDAYLDGQAAEILKFGHPLVNIDQNQRLFRHLIRGLSVAGEVIGVSAILLFPFLEKTFQDILPNFSSQKSVPSSDF